MTFKSKILAATASLVMLGTAAQAADPASCKNIRMSDPGWTEIGVINGIAGIMYDALGYQTESKVLSLPVTFASMKSKDIDIFVGNWMPSQGADIQPYLDDKSVENLSVNLEGAGYGIVVPKYVADAGVKSITDIMAHKDKFGGKFYGIEPGNDGNRSILTIISEEKNNLAGFELVESSEAGMLTEAEKAMKNNEWILFLAWTPHPVFGAMDIHYVDGVNSYGFGPATVYTNTRAGWAAECPNAAKMMSNFKFDLKMVGGMMEPVLKDGKDQKVVAAEWVKANPDLVNKWLEGVTTIDGGDAKAAVAAAIK
jgi:glycine betaine/proline transport system substrate-binding protein